MSRLGRSVVGLPWHVISRLALAVSALLFARALPRLADGDWGRLRISAGHHLWLLGWMLVISYAARARSVLDTAAGVFGGFFTAIWLSTLVGGWTADEIGASDPWQLVVVVPIIEEVTKLIPMVTVALIWRWRTNGSPAVTDMALLGTATGAGFAFHEDSLWGRVSGSGFDGDLGWIVPSAFTDSGTAAGHAVWTGFVGLGMGLWLVNPRRRWSIVAPVSALLVVIVDHGTWNNVEERDQWNDVLLDGRLLLWLFAVGFLATVLWETRLVHRVSHRTSTYVVRNTPRMLRRSTGPRTFVHRWRLAHRMLRGLALRSHNVASLQRGSSRSFKKPEASPQDTIE